MDLDKSLSEIDALFRDGKLSEAEHRLGALLDFALRNQDSSACLALYNEFSGLYRSTGRIQKAVEVADKALSLINTIKASDTLAHATTLVNSATARRMAGDKRTALAQFKRAEEILLTLGRENSFEFASVKNNLSQLYQETEEFDMAVSDLKQALSILESLGSPAGDVATTRVNLCMCYIALGKLDDAEVEIEKALEYYTSSEGMSSGHVGAALSAAADLLIKRGDNQTALSLYRSALDFTKHKFGENYAYDILKDKIADTEARA